MDVQAVPGVAADTIPTDGSGGGSGAKQDRDEDVEGAKALETVLVVDDDQAVLQVASKVLSRGGYDVVQAEGGAEALARASEFEGRFSLLLTDVVMPGMSGRELGERFGEAYPGVPVLFMSAYTEDEILLRGVRLSQVHFIAKPFTVEDLRTKVREVIEAAKG